MDVKLVLALFVCSTWIGLVFADGHHYIQCIHQRCSKHRPSCLITAHGGQLTGQCHHSAPETCEYQAYHLTPAQPSCNCRHSDCVAQVVNINRHLSSGFRCISNVCHGHEVCHIHASYHDDDDDKRSASSDLYDDSSSADSFDIRSECTNKPSHPRMCVNHESILGGDGCYCFSSQCVSKTAMHYNNVTCLSNQGIRISVHNHMIGARCQNDGDGMRACDLPFIPDVSPQPCYCSTQFCLNNIPGHEIPRTPRPTTTTRPTTTPTTTTTPKPTTTPTTTTTPKPTTTPTTTTTPKPTTTPTTTTPKPTTTPTTTTTPKSTTTPTTTTPKPTTTPTTTTTPKPTTTPTTTTTPKPTTTTTPKPTTTPTTTTTPKPTTTPTTTTPKPTATPTTTTTPKPTTTPTTTTTLKPTTPTTTTTLKPTTTPTTTTTPIPTTTPTTTTTPIPTTTPTTTAAPTTTTTPTTTPTPTTTVLTTTTASQRLCHKCGDNDLGIPCSTRQTILDLQDLCSTGHNYCMTDIIQDIFGNVDVFKRCVDKATCEKEWINESADLDYCKQYGAVQNPGAFECHFCCVGDGCNSNLVPSSSTWYTKNHHD